MAVELFRADPLLLYINYLPCTAGFCTAVRELPFPYLLYVHSGRGKFMIGGTTYPAAEGDLFFCSPGVSNRIMADRAAPFTLTGVDFYFERGKDPLETGVPEGYRPCVKTAGRVRWILLELLEQYTAEKGDTACARSLLKSLLCLTEELASAEAEAGLVRRVQRYLIEHTGEELTLVRAASELGYHPHYLNRVFKESMGTTIWQFYLDLRIRKARELLEATDLPVNRIAAECGFPDQNYFSRLFKRKTGVSPTEYRRRK